MDKKNHETQKMTNEVNNKTVFDENIVELQRIEGQGPPKKVILKDLPLPIRIFAIFVMICMGGGLILGIIMTLLN